MTWGRVQSTVDPEPLEALVLASCPMFGIDAASTRVCGSLQEARHDPYFFECLAGLTAKLAARQASTRPDQKWRKKTDRRMRKGRDLSYCGDPTKPSDGDP